MVSWLLEISSEVLANSSQALGFSLDQVPVARLLDFLQSRVVFNIIVFFPQSFSIPLLSGRLV